MTIVRCHRIGKLNNEHDSNKCNRPVIVIFFNYNDRMSVWAKRFELANGHKSISENFANNVEYRRRLLYPILKTLSNCPTTRKCTSSGMFWSSTMWNIRLMIISMSSHLTFTPRCSVTSPMISG